MKFSKDQIEAIAYMFERELGYKHSNYEIEAIVNSGLEGQPTVELAAALRNGIEGSIYKEADRTSVYWALTKRHDQALIPFFQKQLAFELKADSQKPIYQLLIALSNLEEDVFGQDRGGSSADFERELNIRDAQNYLNRL